MAHLSDSTRVAWYLLMNITLDKRILLYFLTHFNLLDLCLWLRGDIVLDVRIVAISCNPLQQVARDNLGILQTLKICLVEACRHMCFDHQKYFPGKKLAQYRKKWMISDCLLLSFIYYIKYSKNLKFCI